MGSPRADENDWLPLPGSSAGEAETGFPEPPGSPRPDGLAALVHQVEGLARDVETLRARVETQEARAVDAEVLRLELLTLREEMDRREEIARGEALPLQQIIAQTSAPSPADLAPGGPRDADPRLDFNDAAGDLEARLSAIEDRVRTAAETVRTLATNHGATGVAGGLHDAAESLVEPEPERGGGRLDINRISFEQLRDLGLTVTQAARLLASRDARGRFRSLDELNDLVGFSRELLEQLRQRLSLG
jgi:DNA uptake protein ComE-like DNA-binding protein